MASKLEFQSVRLLARASKQPETSTATSLLEIHQQNPTSSIAPIATMDARKCIREMKHNKGESKNIYSLCTGNSSLFGSVHKLVQTSQPPRQLDPESRE